MCKLKVIVVVIATVFICTRGIQTGACQDVERLIKNYRHMGLCARRAGAFCRSGNTCIYITKSDEFTLCLKSKYKLYEEVMHKCHLATKLKVSGVAVCIGITQAQKFKRCVLSRSAKI